MERFTHKDADGNWVVSCYRFWNYLNLKLPAHLKGEAIDRLAEYEDSELELEEPENEVLDTEKVLAQFRRWLDSGKLKYKAPSDMAIQYAINLLERQRGVKN